MSVETIEKDKAFMDKVNSWCNSSGDGEVTILAEKTRFVVADGTVNSSMILVFVDHKDGTYHAEILRIWKSIFNGEFSLSCEFQEDCEEEDEYILEKMFKAMARFIPIEEL